MHIELPVLRPTCHVLSASPNVFPISLPSISLFSEDLEQSDL